MHHHNFLTLQTICFFLPFFMRCPRLDLNPPISSQNILLYEMFSVYCLPTRNNLVNFYFLSFIMFFEPLYSLLRKLDLVNVPRGHNWAKRIYLSPANRWGGHSCGTPTHSLQTKENGGFLTLLCRIFQSGVFF